MIAAPSTPETLSHIGIAASRQDVGDDLRKILLDAANALRSLQAERDDLLAYAREATDAITSLVPGGSEYFGRRIGGIYTADVPFCSSRIREIRENLHGQIRRMSLEIRQLREAGKPPVVDGMDEETAIHDGRPRPDDSDPHAKEGE